jgi:hypothetical protein
VRTWSPLRQLSRDYFEGRLDQASYRAQRKRLIDAWLGEAGVSETDNAAAVAEVTGSLQGEHPDADALVNAFASREAGAVADRDSAGASALEAVSLIPDFSQAGSGEVGARSVEGSDSAGAKTKTRQSLPISEDSPDANRRWKWLAVTAVALLASAVVAWTLWV